MARLSGHLLGPFSWWVWKDGYPVFVPSPELRERVVKQLGDYSLSIPPDSLARVYINSSTDVYLYVYTTAYDLVKHFRSNPVLRRRLGSLHCFRCHTCDRYLPTSLTSEPVCEVCNSQAGIVIFWTDPEARVFTIGPCEPSGGRLYHGGKGYFVGEVLNIRRDLYGNLYATVIGFYDSPADIDHDRLLNVSELPEIGWTRPLLLEQVMQREG